MSALRSLPGGRHLRQFVRGITADQRRQKKLQRALKDMDRETREIIERVHPYTMQHPDKLFGLITAVRHIARHRIPGAIVECGVWRGGGMMAVALTLLQEGRDDIDLYLYDTFAGMPPPSEKDVRIAGEEIDTAAEFDRLKLDEESSDWCYASLDEVKRNLATIGYPAERQHFIQGKVEDTLPGTLPEKISLLRLDTDWYESTCHEMRHLMPLLTSGGVFIADDYFGWGGNRDGVDEYLAAEGIPMLLVRVGKSAMGVKP